MTTFIEGAASGGSGGTLGASYNSTLPTYTNGQTSTLQTDSRGQLLVGGISSPVAVTGTFWQTTQPVSWTGQSVGLTGTLPAFAATPTVNIGTAPSLTIGTLPALPAGSNVIGGVTQSGTWNIGTVTTLPVLPAGTNTIGSVNVLGGNATAVKIDGSAVTQPVSGTFWQTTQPVSMAALPALAAGTAAIGQIVGQRPFEAILTITRPANTTAYAAGQVLSTAASALTAFPTLALGIGNSQRFTLTNLAIISSNGAASTKGQFAAYLFSSASPSGGGFNDASTFAPTAAALYASGNVLLGSVPSSLAQAGTAAYGVYAANTSLQGVTDGSGNVYAAVVLANAYTPASAETITVKVTGLY